MSRVAVVTGAGRGIGRAVTHQLAGQGWRVVAVDAPDDEGLRSRYGTAGPEDLVATVAAAPAGYVVAVAADVRDLAGMQAAVDEAVRRFGRLDAAVAAAGIIAGGQPVWATPPEDYAALMEVNCGGVWNLAAAAVPAMLEQPQPRDGRLVAVASAAGHRGLPRLAAYCASKHAVVGIVKGLAADLRGTGITANGVSPGSTDTAMLGRSAAVYGLSDPTAFAPQALLERLLAPDEIAAAVTWLCSGSSSAVTGTVLKVDGGLTT